MAGAYAQLTGKLGVCIASNGPGVANSSQVAVEQAGGTECCSLRAVGARDYLPDRGGAYRRFRG